MAYDRMTILLNANALERLIGGDAEMELRLRQGVVEEFSRRHLKSLASSEMMQKLRRDLDALVAEAALESRKQLYGEWDFWKKPLSERLSGEIRECVAALINATLNKEIEKRKDQILKIIETQINSAEVDRIIQKRVDEAVEKKFATLVARFGQLMGGK